MSFPWFHNIGISDAIQMTNLMFLWISWLVLFRHRVVNRSIRSISRPYIEQNICLFNAHMKILQEQRFNQSCCGHILLICMRVYPEFYIDRQIWWTFSQFLKLNRMYVHLSYVQLRVWVSIFSRFSQKRFVYKWAYILNHMLGWGFPE